MYWTLDNEHNIVQTDDIYAWGRFKEDFDQNCRVGKTKVGTYEVSTVFVGLDLGLADNDPPLLFETLIFNEKGEAAHIPGLDGQSFRYYDWDEAEAGHKVHVHAARRYLLELAL